MAQESHSSLKIASPGIDHEGRLPRKYTGDGQGAQKDISPPVEWYGVPDGTHSLALVVESVATDGDSAIHWVVVNIPPTAKSLPEGFSGKPAGGDGELAGVKEGTNDDKVPGWRGPKPPAAGQRMEFRLYALDDVVKLGNKVTKDKLLDAIEGHVLGEAELVAIY